MSHGHISSCGLISGHTRYSTLGCSDMSNVQPIVVETLHGLIAVAHNGELYNAKALKQKVKTSLTICILMIVSFFK